MWPRAQSGHMSPKWPYKPNAATRTRSGHTSPKWPHEPKVATQAQGGHSSPSIRAPSSRRGGCGSFPISCSPRAGEVERPGSLGSTTCPRRRIPAAPT